MSVSAVVEHRWTREEYERMAAAGCFGPVQRVELIEGIVYDMPPQSPYHASSVTGVQETLRPVFSSGYTLRVQMPLTLDELSAPEPDVAVVAGSRHDYLTAHPRTAVLVVEVADASLAHDRNRKALLYARAGIPEYWLVDLTRRALEVYREPSTEGYRSRAVLGVGATVSPWLVRKPKSRWPTSFPSRPLRPARASSAG
jgi:Uma2 family endonuclease